MLSSEHHLARSGRVIFTRYPRCHDIDDGMRDQGRDHLIFGETSARLHGCESRGPIPHRENTQDVLSERTLLQLRQKSTACSDISFNFAPEVSMYFTFISPIKTSQKALQSKESISRPTNLLYRCALVNRGEMKFIDPMNRIHRVDPNHNTRTSFDP